MSDIQSESPPPELNSPKMSNVGKASIIMVASLFLSRTLGIFRDTVMTAQFGVCIDTDAYRLAFQIPDLIFFALAGGALSSAFIPVFSEFLHTDREEDAWKLFSVVTTLMSVIIIAVIAALWIFAEPVAHLVAPGKADEVIPLIALMSRIVLPAQFAFFVGGLMFGTLYAKQMFAVPGLGPNVYNLGIIFGAIVISSFVVPGIVGMSWGALVGAVIGNLIIPLFAMKKIGAKFRPSLNLSQPGVKKVFKLMLPVVLGLSLPGVYGLIMQAFGTYYKDGINTALDLANKLMQAPLGIFGQSLALAVFPTLSQFFAQKDMQSYRLQLASTLKTVLYITVPISVLMWVFAPDIVALAFAYGKGQNADLSALVDCLRMFSIGIFAWCMQPVLMRGFFAIQNSVTPVVLGTITTAAFLGLTYALKATPLEYRALPLASSISAILLAGMMLFAIRSRLLSLSLDGGGTCEAEGIRGSEPTNPDSFEQIVTNPNETPLDINGILSTLLKSAAAALLVGIACFLLLQFIPIGTGYGRNIYSLLKLFVVGVTAMWGYYFLTKAMGMNESSYFDRAMKRVRN
jgi:putative peptidoglycan lipid II flippase